jgi:hypothetical protein
VPKSGAVSRPVGAEDLTHLRNYSAPPNNARPTGPEGTASSIEGEYFDIYTSKLFVILTSRDMRIFDYVFLYGI